jgi:very-short-patch-repair endonuclease
MTTRALGNEVSMSRVGPGEKELREALTLRGVTTHPQRAVGRYNIDLAAHPVAVELTRETVHPMRRSKNRQRVEYLADRGWRTLYMWCPLRFPAQFSELALDKAVAHIEMAQSDPSAIREYRVIRCTGEDRP